jgi:hypothetical protein
MKKCLFLIPTSYNDGKEIPSDVVSEIFDELFAEFGSYSVAGTTEGAWRLEDGTKVKDKSLNVWIVMDDEKVAILKKFIKKLARILKQEAIYLEVMDWTGEFIGPE